MITVMIVDDHPVVRDGLEVLLASEKEFKIHATAATAAEALALCEKKGAPDVLVSDIRMPEMTGLELLPRMRKRYPQTRVLLLAGMPLKSEEEEARAGGAAGEEMLVAHHPAEAAHGEILYRERRLDEQHEGRAQDQKQKREYLTEPGAHVRAEQLDAVEQHGHR